MALMRFCLKAIKVRPKNSLKL